MQLGLLALATTAGSYSQTALGPLQESMRSALALSDNQVSLLQGLSLALPIIFLSVPLGLWIDRYSRARLLLTLAVVNALGSGLSALAPGFGSLFCARCLAGIAAPASWMAALSVLSDLYPPDDRGRANMLIVIGQCCGSATAFALGGTLLSLSGDRGLAWRHTLLWLTVPLVASIFLMLLLREPPRSEIAQEASSARGSIAQLWRYRSRIVPLIVGVSLVGVANGAATTWTAPTFSRLYRLSPERIGSLMGIVLLISGVLGPVAGGFIADACERAGGPRRTLSALTGLALLSFPTAGYTLTGEAISSSAVLLVYMTLAGAMIVIGTTLFTIVIPNEVRGLCMAFMSTAFLLLGLGLAPLAVSTVSNALGGEAFVGRALAMVCGGVSLLSAASFALGRPGLLKSAAT